MPRFNKQSEIHIHGTDDTGACCYCEREKPVVLVTFLSGFVTESSMCWNCLQKSIRMQSRQNSAPQNSKRPLSEVQS